MVPFFHNFSASPQIDDTGDYPDDYPGDYPGDYTDNDPPKDCYLEPNTPKMRIFSCVPPQPQIPKCCKNTEIIDTR